MNTEPQPLPGRAAPTPGPVARPRADTDIDSSELRDFSHTVAEIDWLLVILVLLYHVFQDRNEDNTVAIYMGLIAFSAVIITFHYLNLVRSPGRWLLAIETWIMIVFITWVLYHTGRLDSPLLNLYLLPIVTSALTLGQTLTLLQMGLIGACYLFLGYSTDDAFFSSVFAGNFAADMAPMLLVAYVTTMLSQDILNAMAKIKLISETDELTGIYNVRAFNAIAERECALAVRHNRTFSLMMIDSDNLKKMNDTHGHEAGDRLIQHVVKCIKAELRTTDVVARYGGDEFICLLPETASAGAAHVGEKVRRRIAETPLKVANAVIPTSVSIGIATHPGHGGKLDALSKNVDRALYVSKAQGRNRVTVFAAD